MGEKILHLDPSKIFLMKRRARTREALFGPENTGDPRIAKIIPSGQITIEQARDVYKLGGAIEVGKHACAAWIPPEKRENNE